jgi:hypothetical protein
MMGIDANAKAAALSVAAFLSGAQGALGATISEGGFTFASSQFATSADNVVGTTLNVQTVADQNLGTGINFALGGVIRLDFSYDIVNGDGVDILGFEAGTPHTFGISLVADGSFMTGSFLSQRCCVPNSGLGLNTFAFDLSDIGVALGANVGSTLFLRNFVAGSTPDILEIAAISFSMKSESPTLPPALPADPSVIPLPAGLPLLLAGLGALGIVKRRSRV